MQAFRARNWVIRRAGAEEPSGAALEGGLEGSWGPLNPPRRECSQVHAQVDTSACAPGPGCRALLCREAGGGDSALRPLRGPECRACPIFHSICEGELAIALESMQDKKDLI